MNQQEKNIEIAKTVYELAFNQGNPVLAAEKYLDEPYIQHNPLAGDGKKAFIAGFTQLAQKYPGKKAIIHHAFAQGNYVILHAEQFWPDGSKYAGMDIFLFNERNRIIEHWDVLQLLDPTIKPLNNNGMF